MKHLDSRSVLFDWKVLLGRIGTQDVHYDLAPYSLFASVDKKPFSTILQSNYNTGTEAKIMISTGDGTTTHTTNNFIYDLNLSHGFHSTSGYVSCVKIRTT